MIRLLSAVVLAFITLSLLQIFLIFFILAKVKLFIISCLTSIKSIAQVNIPEQSFYMKQLSIPGLYVPMFYDAEYNEDMTLASFTPNRAGVPEKIEKQVVTDLSHTFYPSKACCAIYQSHTGSCCS